MLEMLKAPPPPKKKPAKKWTENMEKWWNFEMGGILRQDIPVFKKLWILIQDYVCLR